MSNIVSVDPRYFPSFSAIYPDHIEPALRAMLDQHRSELISLLGRRPAFTFDNLIAPLAELDNELHRFWAPISHLHGVLESQSLRAAYNACIPLLSAYSTERMQNTALCQAIQSIRHDASYAKLDAAKQRIIENDLRDFHLAGVDLPSDKKARFADLQKNLSQLSTRFSENLLDATQAFSLEITNQAELAGLPEQAIQLAAQYARERDKTGFVLTLDQPCYMAVMKHLDNRELRQKIYTAYVTRAENNTPVMDEMVRDRMDLARLTGFPQYANYALASRMAKTSDQVMTFLNDLVERAKPFAQKDFDELQRFARDAGLSGPLQAWDVTYYSEKLQKKLFSLSDEDVRPYFQAEKVVNGMFAVMGKLFGIRLHEHHDIDRWHKDVRFFSVHDASGNIRGYLYTDLYARPHKRDGAWMDECQSRQRLANGELQLPVAFLTCNFTPPVADQSSLLTHDDLQTLFHEFGHCLHHLLTQVEEAGVSGLNGVAWDAVEFPSQFFENWCWDYQTLKQISAHIKTAEPLPEALFQKLLAARHFQSGMHMLRQLEFSLFDFRLHLEYSGIGRNEVQRILDEVRAQVSVVPVPEFNRFQNSFSHIFAGGYAAGYYSYKWAEVLSCDAFSLFEEKGIFDPACGRSFLENILEQGGVHEPMELFVRFRGREPQIDALLRHSGLVTGKIPINS